MKTNARCGTAAFSLIELMAVITIMVLLAGLVIGGMAFVADRQAKEKAKVQMALISKALDEYKLDNGAYPLTGNTATGSNTSSILFKALFYDGSVDATKKIYLAELDPGTTTASSKQGWTSVPAGTTTKILDPWGNEYRYRSAAPQSGTANNSSTQNPDFDLWSVGKDGQTLPSTPSDRKNRDDIKNF